jgi:hypothetical protein
MQGGIQAKAQRKVERGLARSLETSRSLQLRNYLKIRWLIPFTCSAAFLPAALQNLRRFDNPVMPPNLKPSQRQEGGVMQFAGAFDLTCWLHTRPC